jgi:hypothetical protein
MVMNLWVHKWTGIFLPAKLPPPCNNDDDDDDNGGGDRKMEK